MKSVFIFTAVFLFLGICSVAAQDLIILKDGKVIESKVTEISPTEIRYKRFDHLDGPTIVISADKVLSIRYQNGKVETINADTNTGQKNNQAKPTNTSKFTDTAMDPDKFIFAMNANLFSLGLQFEFGKENFNSEVHIGVIPPFGVGVLSTFNYFWHKSYGGFYLGGGVGYIYPYFFTAGLNIGWKFVTRSGVYFRTGTYIGPAFFGGIYPCFKPDLAIGYCFK